MSKTSSVYRRDIQILRGFSVAAIVLFHANENVFPMGYLGVDVFFVISGYVITPLFLRIFIDTGAKRAEVTSRLALFYVNRFFRLAPALAITLVITTLLIFTLGSPSQHQNFARQGISTLLLLGNIGAYKFSGDYFSPFPNPLVHMWSLSVEEQIYLFFPLLVLLFQMTKLRSRNNVEWVVYFSGVLSFFFFMYPSLVSNFYRHLGIANPDEFAFYSVISRVWQFAIGGFLFIHGNSWILVRRTHSKIANSFFVFTLVAILFGPINFSSKIGTILASLSAAIVISLRNLQVINHSISDKLEWIGDRSYSIYLVHLPLLYTAKFSKITQLGQSENRLFQSTCAIVLSFLLGNLCYLKVENRFRRKDKSRKPSKRSILSGAIWTLVIPMCIFLTMDRGVVYRYWGLNNNLTKPASSSVFYAKCSDEPIRQKPCVNAYQSGKSTIVLVGDSHAGQYMHALNEIGMRNGWNTVFWVKNNCRFLLQSSRNYQLSNDCLQNNLNFLKWIKANKPQVVIVSQFVRRDIPQTDLKDAIATLQSIVRSVLIVGNNPVFPDERDFMVERPIFMKPYDPPKNFSHSEMQSGDMQASLRLGIWAQSNGISTLDIEPLFCDIEQCHRYFNESWLYSDASHLSISGAARVQEHLEALLTRTFNQ